MVNIKELEAVIEAILFTMGDSVGIDSLASVIEEDKKTTREILEEMIELGGSRWISLWYQDSL